MAHAAIGAGYYGLPYLAAYAGGRWAHKKPKKNSVDFRRGQTPEQEMFYLLATSPQKISGLLLQNSVPGAGTTKKTNTQLTVGEVVRLMIYYFAEHQKDRCGNEGQNCIDRYDNFLQKYSATSEDDVLDNDVSGLTDDKRYYALRESNKTWLRNYFGDETAVIPGDYKKGSSDWYKRTNGKMIHLTPYDKGVGVWSRDEEQSNKGLYARSVEPKIKALDPRQYFPFTKRRQRPTAVKQSWVHDVTHNVPTTVKRAPISSSKKQTTYQLTARAFEKLAKHVKPKTGVYDPYDPKPVRQPIQYIGIINEMIVGQQDTFTKSQLQQWVENERSFYMDNDPISGHALFGPEYFKSLQANIGNFLRDSRYVIVHHPSMVSEEEEIPTTVKGATSKVKQVNKGKHAVHHKTIEKKSAAKSLLHLGKSEKDKENEKERRVAYSLMKYKNPNIRRWDSKRDGAHPFLQYPTKSLTDTMKYYRSLPGKYYQQFYDGAFNYYETMSSDEQIKLLSEIEGNYAVEKNGYYESAMIAGVKGDDFKLGVYLSKKDKEIVRRLLKSLLTKFSESELQSRIPPQDDLVVRELKKLIKKAAPTNRRSRGASGPPRQKKNFKFPPHPSRWATNAADDEKLHKHKKMMDACAERREQFPEADGKNLSLEYMNTWKTWKSGTCPDVWAPYLSWDGKTVENSDYGFCCSNVEDEPYKFSRYLAARQTHEKRHMTESGSQAVANGKERLKALRQKVGGTGKQQANRLCEDGADVVTMEPVVDGDFVSLGFDKCLSTSTLKRLRDSPAGLSINPFTQMPFTKNQLRDIQDLLNGRAVHYNDDGHRVF